MCNYINQKDLADLLQPIRQYSQRKQKTQCCSVDNSCSLWEKTQSTLGKREFAHSQRMKQKIKKGTDKGLSYEEFSVKNY